MGWGRGERDKKRTKKKKKKRRLQAKARSGLLQKLHGVVPLASSRSHSFSVPPAAPATTICDKRTLH